MEYQFIREISRIVLYEVYLIKLDFYYGLYVRFIFVLIKNNRYLFLCIKYNLKFDLYNIQLNKCKFNVLYYFVWNRKWM